MKIDINSKWYTSEGSVFVVDNVKTVDDNTWVHYHRYGTDQQYNCLAAAFVKRFFLNTNTNYNY